jgi:YggT family protein
MNFIFLAQFIQTISTVFIWIVIASSLLSFFVPPFHPVREALDRIVAPFLNPIRRILPTAGMFDFSPLVLIIAVELVSQILISFFSSL